MSQHQRDANRYLMGGIGQRQFGVDMTIDKTQELKRAKRTYENLRREMVKRTILDRMPDDCAAAVPAIKQSFIGVMEWHEKHEDTMKYVACMDFLLDSDEGIHYKVYRKIKVEEGQAFPDITDLVGILPLSSEEAALIAASTTMKEAGDSSIFAQGFTNQP